ncbi:diguanylate cyclase, partial [Falsirhodobacter halotolerans]|nr:diguanylate cyclase [Falsirhodobacter halotolerans]
TLCARWQDGSAPTPLWAEIEDFATTFGPRRGGSGQVHLLDGRPLHCRFDRLAGGATLVGFRMVDGVRRPSRAKAMA